jgi:hypothetical protein
MGEVIVKAPSLTSETEPERLLTLRRQCVEVTTGTAQR